MLQHRPFDAAVIATTNHHHALPAIMAMRRGIHVFVEKPMALTVGEIHAMHDAARRYGVVTQVGNQGHSSDGIRLAAEYMAAGTFGEVKEVWCWCGRMQKAPLGREALHERRAVQRIRRKGLPQRMGGVLKAKAIVGVALFAGYDGPSRAALEANLDKGVSCCSRNGRCHAFEARGRGRLSVKVSVEEDLCRQQTTTRKAKEK